MCVCVCVWEVLDVYCETYNLNNESTTGADASVEALKLYDMKLLTLAYLIPISIKLQKWEWSTVTVAKKDIKSSKSIKINGCFADSQVQLCSSFLTLAGTNS